MNLLFLSLSPLLSFLQPVEYVEKDSGLPGVDVIYVINLEERPEKWKEAKEGFAHYGLHPTRFSAINGWKIPREERDALFDPRCRSRLRGGEVGCLLSHISLYQDALLRHCSVAWICEDDVDLRLDPRQLPRLLQELTSIDPEWDVLYTDYHPHTHIVYSHRPEQEPFTVRNMRLTDELFRTHSRYGTHSMLFSSLGLQKAWNYFFSLLFWGPLDIDIHYIPGFREYSIKTNLTGIRRGSVSDTSASSSLNQ